MTTAAQIIADYEQAKTDRLNWDTHWQSIADFVLPSRDFTVKTPYGFLGGGRSQYNRIYNATAPVANESLAAALQGLFFNPAIRWFSLAPEDQSLLKYERVKAWLYECTSRMLSWFATPRSGFATAAHEIALDLTAFGTAVMMVPPKGTAAGPVFQARQLSNMYLMEDDEGSIAEQYRYFEPRCCDAMEMFGAMTPGPSKGVREKAADPKRRLERVAMIHGVCKRREYTYRGDTPRLATSKPWSSVYVEIGGSSGGGSNTGGGHVVSEGGFDENPYVCPRWSKAPLEVYGRSPSMTVLPDIKTLNTVAYDVLMSGEMATRPPINVVAGTMEGPVRTAPGSINYYRGGQAPAAMETGANPFVGEKMIEMLELKIERAYFLDILKLPERDRMTATEIIERRQQGLMLAGSTQFRLGAEWLSPVIERTFRHPGMQKTFPPAPAEIRGQPLKVFYLSPLAASQRQGESQAFVAAMNAATSLVTTDPTVMINVEADEAIRGLFESFSVNPKWLRTRADVAKMRQQQQQDQALTQQVVQAQGAAAASRDAAAAIKDVTITQGTGGQG